MNIPETDEQVKEIFKQDYTENGATSRWGPYCIYRRQDNMTVLEAYEKVLLTAIALLRRQEVSH